MPPSDSAEAGAYTREATADAPGHMVRRLGLFSASAIVTGSMIGSGIYIVSADIGRTVGSPALLIAAWVVTAVMTMISALCYGELAAMMPKAGGQYVYLREAFGPLVGFLYGWTLFLVIQTGTIAAVCVGFGKFAGVFFPSISATHWLIHVAHIPPWRVGPMILGDMEIGLSTAGLAAILVALILTALNTFGIRLGALIQNVFTSTKVVALLAVIVAGGLFGRGSAAVAQNFGPGWHAFWKGAGWHTLHSHAGAGGGGAMLGLFTILAVAQVGSLFSADAWNNVTFTAGEIVNPRRNLPLSLAMGTGLVLMIYILINFVYLAVLPLQGDPHGATALARGIQYAAEDRVATAVMEQAVAGWGAKIMAAMILISTFGCANGMVMAGARVYYAMSKDGLFFKSAGRLSPRSRVPAVSLWVQFVWIVVLCVSGSYSQLLDYVIFAVLLFYILCIGGLFVLRFRRPDAERPYRALGYPILPALYIAMATWICYVLLRYRPQYTWPGLMLVLLGVPVYLFWNMRAKAAAENL